MSSIDERNESAVMSKQGEKKLKVVERKLNWVIGITLVALTAIIVFLWQSHSVFSDQIKKCRNNGGDDLEAMNTFNRNFAELKALGLFWV